ncbi:radical SAM protein [Candidatus Woesearchaeota archaeon]|nr:radical SAM protein [Candidatus Woesearchaeota archaeon]
MRYISRHERFGRTVFNPADFTHAYTSEEQHSDLKVKHQVEEKNNPVTGTEGILEAPIRVYYDITMACNLRCKTCLNSSGEPDKDELDTEQSLRTIDGLTSAGVFEVRLSGGEPTFRDDWGLILNHAKERGLIISLNTNGVFSDRTLKKLIELKPDETTVSLDGARDLHDRIRGPGKYDRSCAAIQAMNEAGLRVTINSVMTASTSMADIEELTAVADRYCQDISFFHARPLGRAQNIPEEILQYKNLDDKMAWAESIRSKYPHLIIRTRSSSIKKSGISPSIGLGLVRGGSDGFTRLNIMSNGDIYAGGCVRYVNENVREEQKLGNIVDESFCIKRVWHHSARLWAIRETSRRLQEQCDQCPEYQGKCHGFTPEMYQYGLANSGDPFCIMRTK